MDAAIKLIRLDNSEGTATCKQHAFIPKMFTDKWTNETYKGNVSMCSKSFASDDGEHPTKWDDLEHEEYIPEKCCRKCFLKLRAMGVILNSKTSLHDATKN
jgi:hypothetical protein